MASQQGVSEMRGQRFGSVMYAALIFVAILSWCKRGFAQQQAESKPAANPLVRVLQAKGILTEEEVAQISQASSGRDADQRLAKLLLMKGVISQADYDQTVGVATVMTASSTTTSNVAVIPAVYRVPLNNGADVAPARTPPPPEPQVIPAVAPLRVLPIDVPKQGGLIPDIKLGSGASMKLYGFYKVSAVSDTASPGGSNFPGEDFPLELLLEIRGRLPVRNSISRRAAFG